MANFMEKFTELEDVEDDVEAPTPRLLHSKKNALRTSINESAASSFASGIASNYITPFALAIKASALQIGYLSSFSGLIHPIAQLLGSKLMFRHSRKKIVLKIVILQALIWLPLAALSIMFWKGLFQDYLIWTLIILYTLMMFFGGLAHPAWFSWTGDLIPETDRGKFLSIRNKATGLVSIAAVLIGAFILDATKTKGFLFLGFAVLFAAAFTAKLVSYHLFSRQYSPPIKIKKGSYFTFFNFLKTFDNYGKFAVYQAAFYFALMTASPFFAVYMLSELKFDYITFTLVSISLSVFYLIFSPLFGKFSDKYGNVKLLWIGNILFVITPILWIFIKSPLWLIFIPQLVAGLANAAFVIAVDSFTYDSVSPQRRGICVAYTSLLIGIGTFVGSLLGGYLITDVNFSFLSLNSFFAVFLIAAVLRLLVAIFFLPHIKDEKPHVKKLPPMHVNITHPFKTIHAEIGWVKTIFK